ncbi:MAG: sugar ABC transporter ATP-binding protein [Actinomycetes bacterium]
MNTVEMQNINKSFFGTRVLKDVNFSVRPGEVHALAGENGAGKSTLMKILQGVYTMDSGSIKVAGESVEIHSFQDAQRHGIGMVFQEFSLIPELTVAQNIFLNREPKNKIGFIADRDSAKRASAVLQSVGIEIDVTAKVSSLSRAYQQLTEIAKAIAADAKILILDEPTASLAKHEVDALFKVLKQLTASGVSIIYISHRMDEIYQICDRITVLRDGNLVAVETLADTTPQEVIAHITGRKDVEMLSHDGRQIDRSTTPTLKVTHLSVGDRVKDVSFDLYQGEILGLAGLMGSGRTEILRAVFGLDKKSSGTLELKGEAISIKNPRDAKSSGLALIPEDRRRQGLVMEHSVSANILAANLDKLSHLNFLNFTKIDEFSQTAITDFEIRPPEADRQVKLLSGGNQQKVVIAKWVATNPTIILMDEPTVGVDIGTKVEIMKLVRSLAAKGNSIILVSSELPELLGVCDRILIINNGEIRESLMRHEIRDEDHLQLMVQGINA